MGSFEVVLIQQDSLPACLEVSGHKNSTETKHLGPHELSSIATKSRGVSEFFGSDPTPKWNEENVQTIWLFHLKVCHSVVEFKMGHGSSLAIQSQVSIHFLSSYMYTPQVKVRKWNQVGQCSYTIKVVDSEILPHPIMLSGNSQQNACIHIHIPNRRNEAPHLFSRNMLRCSIHCVSQYTNDLWFLQSFQTSERFPMLQIVFWFVVLHHVLSSMSFLCTNPGERPERKKTLWIAAHKLLRLRRPGSTLPKTNMSRDEYWLEDYFPFEMAPILGDMLVFGGVCLGKMRLVHGCKMSDARKIHSWCGSKSQF